MQSIVNARVIQHLLWKKQATSGNTISLDKYGSPSVREIWNLERFSLLIILFLIIFKDYVSYHTKFSSQQFSDLNISPSWGRQAITY